MPLFWIALALFAVFLVLMLSGITGQEGTTPGHLAVFGILALIGLILCAWTAFRRLDVDGTRLTGKGQLVFPPNGKRLMVPDTPTEHRGRLEKTLNF